MSLNKSKGCAFGIWRTLSIVCCSLKLLISQICCFMYFYIYIYMGKMCKEEIMYYLSKTASNITTLKSTFKAKVLR